MNIWLFAAKKNTPYELSLWCSDHLLGPYEAHSLNPIISDPSLARPGGRFIENKGKLYRFGQNNESDYGNGIILNRVTQLSKDCYAEVFIGNILVKGKKGPHTIDLKNDELLFDYYTEKFNPLAFVTRLKSR